MNSTIMRYFKHPVHPVEDGNHAFTTSLRLNNFGVPYTGGLSPKSSSQEEQFQAKIKEKIMKVILYNGGSGGQAALGESEGLPTMLEPKYLNET